MSDPHHPGPRDDPHGPDARQPAGYETWPGDRAPAQLPAAASRRTLLIAIVAGAVLVVAVAVTLVVVLTRSGRATTPGG